MNTITLPAHFDGTQIRLDVPFPLKRNARLIVTILPETIADAEQTTWQLLSAEGLSGAYGENEPEYTTDLIKEVNAAYAGS